MFSRITLLISFDLFHEIDVPKTPAKTAPFSYSEEKVPNDSEIDKKAPNVVCYTF